ncbi:MAG: hypothetical protein J1E59_05140 [Treponema sp.]|nr:hypothetical protein [Treponema sp.]
MKAKFQIIALAMILVCAGGFAEQLKDAELTPEIKAQIREIFDSYSRGEGITTETRISIISLWDSNPYLFYGWFFPNEGASIELQKEGAMSARKADIIDYITTLVRISDSEYMTCFCQLYAYVFRDYGTQEFMRRWFIR